jgi:SAM-dependent methyltransferase
MFHPDGPTFRELVVQALSSTERGYDLIAPKFERTPFRTPDPVVQATMDRIGTVRTALDLCCGTGAGLLGLRRVATERVVGMDSSAGMLEQARRATAGPGTPVELVRADVLSYPFAEAGGDAGPTGPTALGGFDVVTCFGAFGHIEGPDQPRLAAQVRRALKPGGRFVFVTRERVPWLTREGVILRGFNAAMRVRNALISPPFVMYYLNWMLPRARAVLEREGFTLEVHPSGLPGKWASFVVVVATSPTSSPPRPPGRPGR